MLNTERKAIKMKIRKMIQCILSLVCVILEFLPGSVSYQETANKGTETITRSTEYYDFGLWGRGYWFYNIAFVLTLIMFICTICAALIKKKKIYEECIYISGMVLIANTMCIVMLNPVSVITYIIDVLAVLLILCQAIILYSLKKNND